ncbi:hypothetical protein CYY_009023 [Polysphondylium violaceum]|uniref:AAA ATPase domain-containing protein n=1 Tax=Polysphondylium violaceum TaxID=133409 RepID=A0A8J4V0U2_9MYCE|nr:hypothetical protein CYY_009023 [Polysphondylium violaceum]
MQEPSIKLTVSELNRNESTTANTRKLNVSYLSVRAMQQNDITIGDIIYIVNSNSNSSNGNSGSCCVSVAWPQQKLQSGHILLDSIQRENCNVRIGDTVLLYKTPFQVINSDSFNKRIMNMYPHLDATRLQVICETPSSIAYVDQLNDLGMLSPLIISQITDRYFIKSNSFTININHLPIKFKITNIINSSTSSNSNSNSSSNIDNKKEEDISLLFNNLNISSTSSPNVLPIFRVNLNTDIEYTSSREKETKDTKDTKVLGSSDSNLNFNLIGGLKQQVEQVKELIELSFFKGDLLKSFGVKAPRGILFYGPPGTGKTLLARIVASQTKATLFTINGADILDKYYGMTEKTLQNIFQQASKQAPSIIFIDEMDALCPKRDESSTEVEKRVVGSLLTLMDGTESSEKVVVIGCTNRPDSLDPALRRPGRFDNEIEIPIPNVSGREEILKIFLSKIPNQLTEEQVTAIASKTHGYVGADLEALVKESTLKCFHRLDITNQSSALLDNVSIDFDDMLGALAICKPSSMREVVVEIPKVHWNDIGGQDDIKQKLREAIEWPLKYPQSFERMGIKPPKGILLYGPPGCSKTLMAKALATESGLNFIAIKGPELLSKWVGESERAVRDIFKKARQNSPSILFFDEIDGLAISRSDEGSGAVERVVSQLLTEMDGINPLSNVTIVGATNRPDIIDKAILRPGRIDRILYISPPDFESRKEIFNIHLKKVPHNDIDINHLSNITDGHSGAEIISICREASICAMKEDVNATMVKMSHFEEAIKNSKKGITQEMLDFYKRYQDQSNLQVL